METLREAIYGILQSDNPATVRQCYYALVVRGVIEKTQEYNGTVVRLLTQMRRDRVIPYSWISDNARWIRSQTATARVVHFMRQTARLYRRDLWVDADVSLEIWCEKEALAGVIIEETDPYDVPLMVSHAFSSDTYLQAAAAAIENKGKTTFIYQLGDHDPSGIWIAKQIEKGLRHHAPNAEIYFERVTVTPAQIKAWSLPTRPTRREGNTHARGFVGDSVELDAIEPNQLRALVEAVIQLHLPRDQFAALKAAGDSERKRIAGLVAMIPAGGAL
jgi:hypothetical protein